jgi:hypothetical protein
MIELTLEQRQAVAQQGEAPPRAVDPDTHTTYVLLREETYARVKDLLDEAEADQLLREMYSHMMEVFGREGWDDPAMDIYNDLDPRRQSCETRFCGQLHQSAHIGPRQDHAEAGKFAGSPHAPSQ